MRTDLVGGKEEGGWRLNSTHTINNIQLFELPLHLTIMFHSLGWLEVGQTVILRPGLYNEKALVRNADLTNDAEVKKVRARIFHRKCSFTPITVIHLYTWEHYSQHNSNYWYTYWFLGSSQGCCISQRRVCLKWVWELFLCTY